MSDLDSPADQASSPAPFLKGHAGAGGRPGWRDGAVGSLEPTEQQQTHRSRDGELIG